MGDLLNLRQARKRRERAVRSATADENRIAHGRPKHLKTIARLEASRAERTFDGLKLDPPRPAGEPGAE